MKQRARFRKYSFFFVMQCSSSTDEVDGNKRNVAKINDGF